MTTWTGAFGGFGLGFFFFLTRGKTDSSILIYQYEWNQSEYQSISYIHSRNTNV